jgi:hypothetical protein
VTPSITLNDKYVDRGTVVRLDPGQHEIVISAEGYITQRETIDLVEWDDKVLELKLKAEIATLWPMAWIGYGIAGTGVVVGTVTGALSLAAASEAKEGCMDNSCPVENQAAIDRSLLTAHISTASFVVAGIAATIGTVGLFISLGVEADAEEADELNAALGIMPGGAALRLRF